MLWYESFDEIVARELPAVRVEKEVPLRKHTSFRIGGPARRMAFPETKEQLAGIMAVAERCGVKPFVLGKGTNLLIADEGLDTLVIKTGDALTALSLSGEEEITADAGVNLARLGMFAWQNGLTGFEFAHGIPGSLGGGLVMNAGAYGGELKDIVTEATVLFPDGIRLRPFQERLRG